MQFGFNWLSGFREDMFENVDRLDNGCTIHRWQNFNASRYLLSLWSTDASFITKSTIVPAKSVVFTFSNTKIIKGHI